MPQLRVALAQVNPCVGDLAGNAALVVERTRDAVAAGARLVAFPEMVLTGYPVEDLALRPSFQDASPRRARPTWPRASTAEGLGERARRGRLPRPHRRRPTSGSVGPRGGPQNAAAVLHGGGVVARYAKHHLPNYGVFDEFRYFVPGEGTTVVRVDGVDVALAICEDLWQDGGPVAEVRGTGAGLLAGRQRLAVRAQQGRRAARACARGAPARPAARSRT